MNITGGGPNRAGVAVVAISGLALAGHVSGGGVFLLLATLALVVGLLAGRGAPRTGRTTRRVAWSIAATVIALPLVLGLLVALGGAMSEDFGNEDASDEQSSTLAAGEHRRGDLTRQVRAALESQGYAADGIDCPVGATSQTSYECTGSVAGWQRVVVNVHPRGDFTVVGMNTEP